LELEKWENTASNVILSFGKSTIIVEKREMNEDLESRAKEVSSGIKDLAERLDIDEGVLLHFILNTPEANIKLLQSSIKDKDKVREFILNWVYVEDVLDREIKDILEKC
jgi:hypothetical protein